MHPVVDFAPIEFAAKPRTMPTVSIASTTPLDELGNCKINFHSAHFLNETKEGKQVIRGKVQKILD